MTDLRAIHQFTPTLTSADSISGDVFQLQRLFWRSGLAAPIYADHAAPTVRPFARDWHDLSAYPKTAVVPILVDWSAFDAPPDAAVARRLADERTSILVVGQLLPQKALHDVIPAFARYRESDRTARLYLVGSDRMSGEYVAQL